jgi:Rrf2 family protein
MVLKSQVEWVLHCCGVLSGLPEGRYLATKDLAEYHGVPKEYLSKALQGLSQAGLVISTPGPSGGYRLARALGEITFLDIVEAVEGKRSTFICTEIRQNNPCRPEGFCDPHPCGIARIMWQADEAWRASLRAVTLADLRDTLVRDLPPELLQKSSEWVLART